MLKFNELLAQKHGGTLRKEAARYLSGSVAGALKMETILGGLLRYWEVTERNEECLSTVDCNRAFLQARRNLQEIIEESGADVTAGPLPTIAADEVMIVQVFQNLIENSIRYRGKDAPTVHISAMRAGERWLFAVRDNGIGIDRADFERVFSMFSSLGGTRSGQHFRRGNRTRTLPESGGTPRRTYLGGIRSRPRRGIPIYAAHLSGFGSCRCSAGTARSLTPAVCRVVLCLLSGDGGRTPRRPAWEAGILPLNYSRSLPYSA